MSSFSVNTKELKANARTFLECSQELRRYGAEIESIKSELDPSCAVVIPCLEEIERQTQEESMKLAQYSSSLVAIALAYEQAEQNIVANSNSGKKGSSGNSSRIRKRGGRNSSGGTTSGSQTDTDSEEMKEYIKSMMDLYGFSEEDARLLYDAYEKFNNSDLVKGLSNEEKIHLFYSNLSALFSGYSADDTKFKYMGGVPSTEEAIEFFNKLGIDGSMLQHAIENQHRNCGDNRDFAHECAMYAVFSHNGIAKAFAGSFENVDSLIGFKGDIYSGRMGMDDIKSDVAAVNIYMRMLNSKDGNIFGAMTDYNNGVMDGTINESEEFLRNYGDGSVGKGLRKITDELIGVGPGSVYLIATGNRKGILKSAADFYAYLIQGLLN